MGESLQQNRMERFAEVYGPGQVTVRLREGRKWLEVSDPAVLASFVAFCKLPLYSSGLRVYLRGESSFHAALVPSLFRDADDEPSRRQRWAAYRDFLRGLPRVVKGTRFTQKNFGAVLQHYGFRTPWLDVVDDLNVAIWFALNRWTEEGNQCTYRPSDQDQGWLVIVAVPRDNRVLDLRNGQSSRNVRCHTQQGTSISMQHDDARQPRSSQDFMPQVVGTVRIPNERRWRVTGHRASRDYFFPPTAIDDTYRKLLNPEVSELATDSERSHDLKRGTLGRTARYRAVDSFTKLPNKRMEPTRPARRRRAAHS